MHRPTRWSATLSFAFCVLTSAFINADITGQNGSGVLDQPLPVDKPPVPLGNQPSQLSNRPSKPILAPGAPAVVQQALRDELDEEQEELEKLSRPELQEKADKGERAAQITLAEDFAREAAMLAFAPEAANDALSDAARYYILAAMRGFPGAPSLDQAGVQFYPLRVQRSRKLK